MSPRERVPLIAIQGIGCVLPPDAVGICGDQRSVDAVPANGRKIQDGILVEGTGLSRRDLKKMDRMAMLALFAARSAIHHAALSPDEAEECGIITGNSVGGWSFTEPQLRSLYDEGLANISPYLVS
jgi:3-oxoacyl-(acyl-carrier-protein) synthase